MADQFYQEQYPYNTKPTYRIDGAHIKPGLKNLPDSSKQFIIFDRDNLVVIKGWEWKSRIELNNFFVPVENFQESEILLKSFQELQNEFITVNFNNLSFDDNKASFLCIIPNYLDLDDQEQKNWKLSYKINDEAEWKTMSRILMLSTGDNLIEKIDLKNEMGESVLIKLLAGGK